MTQIFKFKLLCVALGGLLLTGCGDAETTIVEQDPIEVPDDGHDHGDDHGGDHAAASGRLAVMDSVTNQTMIFDLEEGALLDTFSLLYEGSRLSASADYRYVVITNRNEGRVGFIDGGLWQEDHGDHAHPYNEQPMMSDYELFEEQPTHLVGYQGQLAIFYDGNAELGLPASVQVITDNDIANEATDVPTLMYSNNMHGVALARGDYLFSTIRRTDIESSSNSKTLPDQVGVYHLHDTEYELEHTLETLCPDLHGAAQNHDYVAFGCSDGVMIAHQHEADFESVKIDNIDGLNGLRVGSLYGHKDSETFIGVASAHGHGEAILVAIDPQGNNMELIDWGNTANASPLSYAFSNHGEHFLILDDQGFLNILHAHAEGDHVHWEVMSRLDITEENVADMPEGASFSMTVAQNGHYAFIADPIAQHVLTVNLEEAAIEGDMELEFVPGSLVWLGIEGEENAHEH
ncbi:MAG: 5-methyltetrahydrofolate--homocysteine methyltransferase [Idiomarina sp.]